MVLNPGKCSLVILADSWQTNLIGSDEIPKNTKQEKALGVTLHNRITFATH